MKKFVVTFLAVVFVFAALVSCVQADTWRPAPAVFNPDWPTLTMGTSAGFFPFEFIAREGEAVIGRYAGIDISLVARIGHELEMNVEVMDMEFPGLIFALQSREVDFVAAAMTIRPDRAEQVNFSVPYFTAGQWVVVRQDSPHQSVADLAGAVVGVQIGTTGDFAVTDGNIELQDIIRFNQPAHGIPDLVAGSLDAFVIDAAVARGLAATHSEHLRAFPDMDFFGAEQYGMAFHLEDIELRDRFNGVLQRLIDEGYVEYLYTQYTRYFSPAQQ